MDKLIGKMIVLVILSFVVLLVAWPFGPLGQLPQAFLVDEKYLKSVRNQDLYLGLVTFFLVLSANILIKLPIAFPVLAAIIGGTLFVIFAQSSEPDFVDYLGSAIFDFHANYLLAGILVTLVFIAVGWWFRREKKSRTPNI